MFYLHGLVVNTENGTLCLKSSVMCSARGGLEQKDYVLNMNAMILKSKVSLLRLTLAGWCLVQGLQVQEQKQSDFCWCRMKRLNCGQLLEQITVRTLMEPTRCECWGGHI